MTTDWRVKQDVSNNGESPFPTAWVCALWELA